MSADSRFIPTIWVDGYPFVMTAYETLLLESTMRLLADTDGAHHIMNILANITPVLRTVIYMIESGSKPDINAFIQEYSSGDEFSMNISLKVVELHLSVKTLTFGQTDTEQKLEMFLERLINENNKRLNAPLEPARTGFVYLIQGLDELYKIGRSKVPKKRIRKLEVKLPFPIDVVHLIPTNDMYIAEKTFHNRFDSQRVRGEWFDLDQADIDYIQMFDKFKVLGVAPEFPQAVSL